MGNMQTVMHAKRGTKKLSVVLDASVCALSSHIANALSIPRVARADSVSTRALCVARILPLQTHFLCVFFGFNLMKNYILPSFFPLYSFEQNVSRFSNVPVFNHTQLMWCIRMNARKESVCFFNEFSRYSHMVGGNVDAIWKAKYTRENCSMLQNVLSYVQSSNQHNKRTNRTEKSNHIVFSVD